jgi:hypothetical protein
VKKKIYLTGLLLLSISACSWVPKVAPVTVKADVSKEDRPKLENISCDCEDPEKLSHRSIFPYAKEEGVVSIKNKDYDAMAKNQAGRIRFQKHGRSYKRCILRCLKKYNIYLDKNQ